MDDIERLLAEHRQERIKKKPEEKMSYEWKLMLRLMDIMIHPDGICSYYAPNNITAANMMVTALEEKAKKHPILWAWFVKV